MKAIKLYEKLEKDFIHPGLSDEWAIHMDDISEYLSANFKHRSMGLVCDFSDEINHVFTAVFPSNNVMEKILSTNISDAMLFVHHPSIWDIRKTPVFYQMDKRLLEQFRKRRISIYNLHVPLDNYSPYSTSVAFAKALGIQVSKPFALYFGGLCGVFGKSSITHVHDIKKHFESVVCHKVSLYQYGEDALKNNVIAIIAGGGNDLFTLEEVAKEGVNTLVTGITAKNSHSIQAHAFAKKNRINILGGTHYSTEKFACMEMAGYFKKLALPSEFISDSPVFEDM